jgi:hypothetical protein
MLAGQFETRGRTIERQIHAGLVTTLPACLAGRIPRSRSPIARTSSPEAATARS